MFTTRRNRRGEQALNAASAVALVLVLAAAFDRSPAAWLRRISELILVARSGAPATALPARVDRAIDGDTLELDDGSVVRILGIDTPETLHPDMDGSQPLGEAASARLAALVDGREVALEPDVAPTDHYGRQLHHVWLGRRLVAEVLLAEGLGYTLVIPPNVRHAERLRRAENSARAAGAGVWGLPRPTPLAIFAEPEGGGP